MAFTVTNSLGAWGERVAGRFYRAHGYLIVARNICNPRGKRYGEIDLIARRGKVLAFVEVKTRRPGKFGLAIQAINPDKQRKLLKTVQWFLNAYPQYQKLQPRIDICAIDVLNLDKTLQNVTILPNALELTG
jgi:putative endonuclease